MWILIKKETFVNPAEKFEYLGVIIYRNGIRSQNIRFEVQQARQIVGAPTSGKTIPSIKLIKTKWVKQLVT